MAQKKTTTTIQSEATRITTTVISYLLTLAALGLGIYLDLALIHLIIFVLFAAVILRPTSSRQLAALSLAFLLLLFLFIFLKQYEYVEQSALGIYIFFALAVLTAIFESRVNGE